MRRFLVSGAAALASFVGVALAAGVATGPVSAQCMVVTCPQPATPVLAPPLQAPPVQAPPLTVSQPAYPPATDAYDEGFAAGRAAGRAEAVAERRPAARSASRQTSRQTTRQRPATARRQEARRPQQRQATRSQASRTQASRPQASRPQPTRSQATRRHPAPPSAPRQAWQSRTRDLAATYGASDGQAVSLAQFTGRGDRWVSSSYSRTVWVAPSVTSWSGGQLCGWGHQAVMQGSTTISQSPAWLCQCAQGWRPPAGH